MGNAYDPTLHHRRSHRLAGYNYARPGTYFVTVCEVDRHSIFGDIYGDEFVPSRIGVAVLDAWEWFSRQYSYSRVDRWVLMPNHFHATIILTTEGWMEWDRYQEACEKWRLDDPAPAKPALIRKSLGSLVGAFKTVSTKYVNAATGVAGASVWQRDFYDHIVRDLEELYLIREYIRLIRLMRRWSRAGRRF